MELRVRLRHDERAVEVLAQLERAGDGEVVLALPPEVDRRRPIRIERAHVDRSLGELRQPLVREHRTRERGDPEHSVTAECANELPVGDGLRARLARVELHDAHGFGSQLVDGARPRVALEETNRDERGDDAGEHDAEQEERRESKSKRPEHGPSLPLDQAFAGSRAGLTL